MAIQDVEGKETADADMLRAVTEILKNALEEFDVDATDGIMEKIKSYRYSPELEAFIPGLAAAVPDFDQDAAEEIINNIQVMII